MDEAKVICDAGITVCGDVSIKDNKAAIGKHAVNYIIKNDYDK